MPARSTNRTTIDNRRILLTLEHSIIGLEHNGPGQPMTRHTIETVLINAIRDASQGDPWALGVVETRGGVLGHDGGPTGLSARRDYHPDHITGRSYHHADMPTELAKLVHDEIAGPDKPTLAIRTGVIRELLDALDDVDAGSPQDAFQRAEEAARRVRAITEPTLTVRWDYDEHVTILLDGETLSEVDHDNYGWDGVRAAIEAAEAMAAALGLPVITEGSPNV